MKPIIIANWKMNPANSKLAFDLAQKVRKGVIGLNAQVVLCPPFVFLPQLLPTKNVQIGAQNCSWEQKGALTGEVSPKQLKSLGCTYVILGHSERKKYLGETPRIVQKKVAAALKSGLNVVLCIENVAELRTVTKSIRNFKNILVVFEPSSAISTQAGKLVLPRRIAREVKAMKNVVGDKVRFLYGGSVDAKNIRRVLEDGKVEGVLVGAASLKPKEFLALVKNAEPGRITRLRLRWIP
tara:strand:- start:620 stop:1336 length:717 start_codon:yes stop_codon:yes gene_type:complete